MASGSAGAEVHETARGTRRPGRVDGPAGSDAGPDDGTAPDAGSDDGTAPDAGSDDGTTAGAGPDDGTAAGAGPDDGSGSDDGTAATGRSVRTAARSRHAVGTRDGAGLISRAR